MKSVLALAAAATLVVCGAAQAHGPVRLKLELSETLDATPDEVWAEIGRFDDMSWHPAVARTELTSADATTPDASARVLHLNAGGNPTITEQLTKWQPEKRCYAYMITQVEVTVLPVTNYASTLCVKDAGGKAEVVWKGGFYRGYPNNDPPPELNDEAAMTAVTGIYRAGLDALVEKHGRAQ
ncbi:SRPBCC family protein [Paracoccus sp. (in: a-proteobacteria)]|uniref:SRPBCC family protein n=1 Tax=Paracoccus sp. TaxID=267 RepID=UPI0026E10B92|nr:SRPBCC family protein [Paracoccus sp. (in: a-proteobacteria)]MDO5368765.1 SRPBCC family protein [Paracoccus sp. (in: a-proteobacteria)]